MVGLGPVFWVSCYLVVWWTVLFAILPLGAPSQEEEGEERHPSADWGAPSNPRIGRKFLTTTWVSALVLAGLFVIVEFGLIPLPQLGSA